MKISRLFSKILILIKIRVSKIVQRYPHSTKKLFFLLLYSILFSQNNKKSFNGKVTLLFFQPKPSQKKLSTEDASSRDDLSHPVHGDNCLLQLDGSCVKKLPAYTWRDYSAIVYLNEQFEGGQFIMTDPTARQVKVGQDKY